MAEAGGAFVTRSFEKLLKDAPGRRYSHLHLALKAYLGLSCQNTQSAAMQNSAPLFVFFLDIASSRFVTNWLFRGFFVPNSPSSMNRGGENSNDMCVFFFFSPFPASDVQIFLLVVVLKGKGMEIEAFHAMACVCVHLVISEKPEETKPGDFNFRRPFRSFLKWEGDEVIGS